VRVGFPKRAKKNSGGGGPTKTDIKTEQSAGGGGGRGEGMLPGQPRYSPERRGGKGGAWSNSSSTACQKIFNWGERKDNQTELGQDLIQHKAGMYPQGWGTGRYDFNICNRKCAHLLRDAGVSKGGREKRVFTKVVVQKAENSQGSLPSGLTNGWVHNLGLHLKTEV